MIAGQLNDNIEIYSSYLTKNEIGEQVEEWIMKNKTKARIIHNSGSRSIENYEIVYNYVRTFQVRIYVDVNELDRIKWDNRFYRILNIDKDKERQLITITTEIINE